ncbi:class F sortase [Kribbella sindirgiensis]|uniref:Class F sortase n=1 Tax=Kribbella sindirgiensis TaxID=1124744 RepID=A0A4R0IT01_9ACTN|nr:class F sortase [Kribbella sindirgiensis]TCC34626.1 class F sortase [Kribbella sindirgiensis]
MISTRGAAVLATAALAVVTLTSSCSSPDRPARERTGPATTVPLSPPTPAIPSPASSLTPRPSSAGIAARPADPPTAKRSTAPIRLQIQAIGIDMPVLPVGVAPNGQMDLPPDPATIGWYRFGPSLDSPAGSVVLGGHLDSKEYGVGPLVRLRELQPGALIVLRSAGSTATYRVGDVEQVRKTSLALDRVFARDGSRALRIVTCGGPYNRDRGGYRDNLVVTARAA